MGTYVIGDVHGCYPSLMALLEQISFNPQRDRLIFCGDLVNRGPDNPAVLRFVMSCPSAETVLGNHDLYLLALAHGVLPHHRTHALDDVMHVDDCHELVEWLRHRPMLLDLPHLKTAVVHAGLHPAWSWDDAQGYAREIEGLLRGPRLGVFLKQMMGNYPHIWREKMIGWARLRLVVNIMTRMRYMDAEGGLDYDHVGPVGSQPEGLTPWFDLPGDCLRQRTLCFGHWSSLKGTIQRKQVKGLDGGCVWGGELLALRLEDQQLFSEPAQALVA